jgi:hypothetical protein
MDHCYGTILPASQVRVRFPIHCRFLGPLSNAKEVTMGRGILLWLLGVPIPIIILLALIWH